MTKMLTIYKLLSSDGACVVMGRWWNSPTVGHVSFSSMSVWQMPAMCPTGHAVPLQSGGPLQNAVLYNLVHK